jgi:CDP-diacylglycerol--serine O-phosphatidyltransferase
MIRQFLNPPNWFSAASLYCGLYAILLAGSANGNPDTFYQAGLMIFYAGLFDGLDGRVARLTGTGSAFGVQLDSLIDIVSFGVAPAALVYAWGLQPYGAAGSFLAFFFMLCGAFRLARFNLSADGNAHTYSQGCTITMGGGTLAAMVMWQAGSGRAQPADPVAVAGFTLAIALLMVSSVPYRTLKTLRRSPWTLLGLVAFAAAFLVAGIVYDISTVLFTVGTFHVLSGPLEYMATWPRRRRARKAEAVEKKRRRGE